MKNLTLCTLVFFTLSSFCFGQFEAVFYENEVIDTLYALRKNTETKRDIDIVFPLYDYNDTHLVRGYSLKTKGIEKSVLESLNSNKDSCLLWEHSLTHDEFLNVDSNIVMGARLYAKGIKSYYIGFYSKTSNSWYFEEKKATKGFQTPILSFLKDFKNQKTSALVDLEKYSKLSIDKIIVITDIYDLDSSLIIGELFLGKNVNKRINVKHDFFEELLEENEESHSEIIKEIKYELLLEQNEIYSNGSLSGSIFIEPKNEIYDEKLLIKKIIDAALKNYPFYMEKQTSLLRVQGKFDSLWAKIYDEDLCSILEAINSFVDEEYNDAHFGTELGGKCLENSNTENLLSGPIRPILIDHKLLVGAVLDSSLSNLKAGSEILKINKVKSSFLIDSLRSIYNQVPHRTENSIANNLLSRTKNDSTHIVYLKDTGEKDSLIFHYNNKISIPLNFKTLKHGKFEILNDSIAYFSIRNWRLDVYLKYLNNWEALKNSKGIILDLRGNGGGEELSAVRLFSTFINEPAIFSNIEIENEIQSTLVKPNPFFRTINQPVVILGDWLTACSSESFILAMKQLPNVHFIASSNTYGSLATRYNIILPSKNLIFVNGLAGKSVMEGVIEDKGISPDINISINSVDDLLPYQDKVLKEALLYFRTF